MILHSDNIKDVQTAGQMRKSPKIVRLLAIGIFFLSALVAPIQKADAKTSRIKDIVDIEGVRDNQLIGYGLVVGLTGTGDSLGNSPFTERSLVAMLERMGVNVRDQNMNTGNVAAVMVTATLPPLPIRARALISTSRHWVMRRICAVVICL